MAKKKPDLEIERKFLVHRVPAGYERRPHQRIAQGYLTGDDGAVEVRLRCKGSRYFLTIKKGEGRVRQEAETELSREQFDAIWPFTEDRLVEKIRYEIPLESHLVEFDIYEGRLAPLATAEVEFDSLEASEAFRPPPWFGEEVTGDARFRNRNLALYGRPEY